MYQRQGCTQRLLLTGLLAAVSAQAQFGIFKQSITAGIPASLQPSQAGTWVSGDDVAESTVNGRFRVRNDYSDRQFTCIQLAGATYCETAGAVFDVYRLEVTQDSPWLSLYAVDYDSVSALESRKELTKAVMVLGEGAQIVEHYTDSPDVIRNLIVRGSLRFAAKPEYQFLRAGDAWARSQIGSLSVPEAERCDLAAGSKSDPLNPNPETGLRVDQIDLQQAEPVCRQAVSKLPDHPRYWFLYGRTMQAMKKTQDAKVYLSKAAEMGYPAAFLELGMLKVDSANVSERQEGLRYLMRASQNDIPLAYSIIGLCYMRGSAVPQDFVQAVKYFEAGMRGGDDVGALFLADAYYYGEGAARDPEHAMALYRSLFNRGRYVHAAYMSGMVELYHRKDPIRALHYFEEAARGNSADAEFQLGSYYYFDQNDPGFAFEYFDKAARKNHAKSQFMVGSQYLLGAGVAKNPSQGIYWLQQSSRQGWDLATLTLGDIYREGQTVPRDVNAARSYLNQAARSRDAKIRNQALAGLQQLDRPTPSMRGASLGDVIAGGALVLFGAWAVNKIFASNEDSSQSSSEKDDWLQKVEEDRRREEKDQKDRERSECIARGGFYGEITGCAGQQW